MKHCFTYLLIGFLFVSLHTEGQRNALTETETNTVQRDFRKILILGSGSVETRAFLDRLTTRLIAELQRKKIETAYYFTGKDSVVIPTELNWYLTESSNAMLVFRPLDSSQYNLMRYKKNIDLLSPFFGNPTNPGYSRKIDFQVVFYIRLYTPQQESDTIWGAMLEVEGDYIKNPQIDVMVKKILTSLKANKVVK